MFVSSKDNPNVKLYRKLSTDKKTRMKTGLFAIEGMRICVDTAAEAARGNIEIEALFLNPVAAEKYSQTLPVENFGCIDKNKCFEISPELDEKMSSEAAGRGAYIIAKKIDKPLEALPDPAGGKYLVLDFVQDPGNLGTLMRTADAVGVSGVVLTNNCCDMYNPKVVRSTMGSMSRLNIYTENDFSRAAEIFHAHGIRLAAAVVGRGTNVTEYDFSKPCAVVIGNEGNGISPENAALCDDEITICMKGNINSLNAATAGTIMLWEMTRERSGK